MAAKLLASCLQNPIFSPGWPRSRPRSGSNRKTLPSAEGVKLGAFTIHSDPRPSCLMVIHIGHFHLIKFRAGLAAWPDGDWQKQHGYCSRHI
jgi:hypothetical protein